MSVVERTSVKEAPFPGDDSHIFRSGHGPGTQYRFAPESKNTSHSVGVKAATQDAPQIATCHQPCRDTSYMTKVNFDIFGLFLTVLQMSCLLVVPLSEKRLKNS